MVRMAEERGASIGMNDTWFPKAYLTFEDERTRPARDLLAQVPLPGARKVIDMGCGPGNSTELLVGRFPDAEVIGLDNSDRMLAEARQRLPQVTFAQADAASWLPEADVELVFANAIYQWVPEHMSVLPRVLAALPPGGVLALQMPDNHGEPSHTAMKDVAADGPWAERLVAAPRPALASVREYYNALAPHVSRLDIWHIVYNHPLEGPEAIVEWVTATGLRPFLEPLSEDERKEFLARYAARIADAYPLTEDGRVLLRFPRLFIVAMR
jgi:trans-aconitate 2-methyltransferase